MTYATVWQDEYDPAGDVCLRRTRSVPPAALAIVMASLIVAGACGLDALNGSRRLSAEPRPGPARMAEMAENTPPMPLVADSFYRAQLEAAWSLGAKPQPLADTAPVSSAFEAAAPSPAQAPLAVAETAPHDAARPPSAIASATPAQSPGDRAPGAVIDADVPLPAPRPLAIEEPASPGPVRAPRRQFARLREPSIAPLAAAPADNRSFFERMFGIGAPPAPDAAAGHMLAYAAPDDGAFGRGGLVPSPMRPYDRFTAVYDISAHTVYMPDGARLEAHSGLREFIDDPRSVHIRNRGATPPHLYDLTLREQLFHGVQALRLNPVGGGGVFGRVGLLAHTYMLGPNGDSNGCVSFRDYRAFLQAYQRGEIRRLAVVDRMI